MYGRYVVDWNNKEVIQELKIQLFSKFDMKDLGATNYYFGHGNSKRLYKEEALAKPEEVY